MDDVASGTQSDLPASNVTRAYITHKVPDKAKAGSRHRSVKMAPHRRRHVKQLKKRGVISDRVAKGSGV